MLWAILGAIIFLAFLFLLVGLAFHAKNKAKKDGKSESSDRTTKKKKSDDEESWKDWEIPNALQLFIAWTAIYFFGWWRWPIWWWENMFTMAFLVFASMFIIFFLIQYHDPKKPFRYKLANVMTLILIILATEWLIERNLPTIKDWAQPVTVKARGLVASLENSSGLLPRNTETEIAVRKFWNSTDLSLEQKNAMIEHARLESNFNQLRPDGTPYRVVPNDPEDDTSAVGVMQVKESVWGEEAKDKHLNLKELEGNLKFSLWIVKKRIVEGKRFDIDWDSTTQIVQLLLLGDGSWSDEVKTFGDFKWNPTDGAISILVDDTLVLNDTSKTKWVEVPCGAKRVRFRSLADKPVVVTVVRKFTHDCR